MEIEEYSEFLTFYIIASISILLNIFVIAQLYYIYLNHTNRVTRLPFYHHIALLGQQITSLPFLFKRYSIVCESIAIAYNYFSLLHLFIIVIYIEINRIHLCDYTASLSPIVVTMSRHWFLILVPCVSMLPSFVHSYTKPDNPWCAWSESNSMLLEILVLYLWIVVMIAHSLIVNLRIIWSLFRKYDSQVLSYYSWFVALYSLLTFISWIPRTLERFQLNFDNEKNDDANPTTLANIHFISFFPMYFASIFYCFVSWKQLSSVYHHAYEYSVDNPQSTIAYSLIGNDASGLREIGGDQNSLFSTRWSDFSRIGSVDRDSFLLDSHRASFNQYLRHATSNSATTESERSLINDKSSDELT
eukprot:gene15126-16881_t